MLLFNRVTIVGVGLIGGSLGMALRRRRLARQVVGWSRKPRTLRLARRCGAIDAGTTNLRRAVAEANVIVLATPGDTIIPLARRVAPFMRPGSFLTDVGSSKARIINALDGTLPNHVPFVGTHPLAGSEVRGIDAARADLFERSCCIITSTRTTNPKALAAVRRLWHALGCRVVVMNPERHDALLAATSHLSHALAWCLAGVPTHEALAVAPPSFMEMTRIAKSDPRLWEAIFLSNRAQLLRAMSQFERRWKRLRSLITQGRRAPLHRFLTAAPAQRMSL
jgi:prephenate dehydrogenase